jgi:hypothetical protein
MREKKAKYVICCAVILMMVFVPLGAYAAKAKAIGKITKVRGNAQLTRVGKVKPLRVKKRMKVFLNDKIKTAAKSAVRIKLKDGSVLSLGAKAQLELDEFEFSQDKQERKAFFSVLKGKLRVFANDLLGFKKKSFKVKTPTAVCGVRGTVFLVWVKSGTLTQVVCYHNEVEVANVYQPEDFIVLAPEESTDVILNQSPGKPVLLSPEQMQELESDLGMQPGTLAPATGEPLGGPADGSRVPAGGTYARGVGTREVDDTFYATPGITQQPGMPEDANLPPFPPPPDPPDN